METTIENAESLGNVVGYFFQASDSIEIFGLSLTWWFAIVIILSAVAMIIKGAKS